MIFLCTKVPRWLEKCWLSAQSFAFGEPGGMRRPGEARTGENGWGWTATGQEQDAGKAHKAWRDSTGRRQARAGGYDGILSGMRSSVSFSGRVAAKAGQWRLPEREDVAQTAREGAYGARRRPSRGGVAGQDGAGPSHGADLPHGPQAAPASDAKSPAGIGSDAGGALRSVIRYCGVSEGAQSGARSSKAV